nr:MAG TPA: hypothetical protein [Caudoviricetes sp.]
MPRYQLKPETFWFPVFCFSRTSRSFYIKSPYISNATDAHNVWSCRCSLHNRT